MLYLDILAHKYFRAIVPNTLAPPISLCYKHPMFVHFDMSILMLECSGNSNPPRGSHGSLLYSPISSMLATMIPPHLETDERLRLCLFVLASLVGLGLGWSFLYLLPMCASRAYHLSCSRVAMV